MRIFNLILAFTSLVLAKEASVSNTIESVIDITRKHHHRRNHIQLTTVTSQLEADVEIYKRNTMTSSSTVNSSSLTHSSSTTTMMPKLKTNTISSSSPTSYSYSLDIPSANESGSFKENPYIVRTKEPENLVFIIVGAILGACALGAILVLFVTWLTRRRIAKSEKEVYYHTPTFNGFSGFLESQSSSSSLEKSSINSTPSLLMLSRQNSMMLQQQSDTSSTLDISQQGRPYRNNVAGNRCSMFISPVLEFMNTQKSGSQFDLPLYNRNPDTTSISHSFMNSTNSSLSADYAFHDIEKERLLSMDTDSKSSYQNSNKPRKTQRPPTQFLDELIDLQDSATPGAQQDM